VVVSIGIPVLTVILWLLPVEVAQNWALSRAGTDEFEQVEAYRAATASVWFLRVLTTTISTGLIIAWPFRRRITVFFSELRREVCDVLVIPAAPLRTGLLRVFVFGWIGLALYHGGASIQRRLWDWPVFQAFSGHTILPNISNSNREVIRYLEAVTPPGSRIFVVSDQKLFFLSYYLLPRRLYHPTHPDSVYVIPKPYNQRQLAAYQLEDLDPPRIARLRPDYILEYFEGTPYLEGRNLSEDQTWVAFQRQRRGAGWHPQYLVALRPWDGVRHDE